MFILCNHFIHPVDSLGNLLCLSISSLRPASKPKKFRFNVIPRYPPFPIFGSSKFCEKSSNSKLTAVFLSYFFSTSTRFPPFLKYVQNMYCFNFLRLMWPCGYLCMTNWGRIVSHSWSINVWIEKKYTKTEEAGFGFSFQRHATTKIFGQSLNNSLAYFLVFLSQHFT